MSTNLVTTTITPETAILANTNTTFGDEFPSISSQQVRIHRIRMTIVHYLLTYPQWSVVLFMYLASITTFSFYPTTIVSDTLHDLQFIIQSESNLYISCLQNGDTHHQQNFNSKWRNEIQRVQDYRSRTYTPYIQDLINQTNECVATSQAARRALQTWQNQNRVVIPTRDIVPVVTNTTFVAHNDTATPTTIAETKCTFSDHEALLEILSHDVNLVQHNIRTLVHQYMTESLQSIRQLVQYTQDRSQYDYQYFIGIKIQTTLQLLDQFAFLTPSWNMTTRQLELTVELRKLLQDLLQIITSAHVQIDTLSVRLRDFQTSINAFYVNYMNLYLRFDSIQSFVADFLPLGVALPSYFDISDLPLPHSLLPSDFFNIPNFNTNNLPDIDLLANTFIEKTLQLLTTILLDVMNEITNQAQSTVQQFIELLRRHLQLNDYHPPQYPTMHDNVHIPPDEIVYVTSLSETTQVDLQKSLDSVSQRDADAPISMNYDVLFSDVQNGTAILNDTNPTQFPLLDILYPTEKFDFLPHWIVATIALIWSHSFIIECMTQAYRLRKLKRKYEQDATPDLPNIDYVVEENATNDEAHEKTLNYRMSVLRNIVLQHVMNPWIIVGLVLLPFMFVAFVFWFPHVKESCIDSRHGTYLAKNIWTPININRANAQGRIHHHLQQIQCYSRQRNLCHTQMMVSDSTFRSDMNTLLTLQTRYNESKSIRDVVRKCVDTNILDELFHLHCCGLEGYDRHDNCHADQQQSWCPIDPQMDPPASFRPVSEALSAPACLDYPTLDEHLDHTYFNCSAIEQTCSDVPCTGVDEHVIELMTIEADCILEVYAIQVCIFLAVAIYHAIMINIINRLLFHGLLQIQWKRLKPDGVTLITSIDSEGHLTKGNDAEERAELVRRVMKQYVRTGYLQVGISVAVFFIWITTIFVIRHVAGNVSIYSS